jgi:glutamyl-tRNA synthetase
MESPRLNEKANPVRGRLAPSPTGALHLGNARSFLLAWLSLRAQGGTVVLRIEDLDHPKVKPGSTQLIYDDLKWLGLDWDEGPDIGGPFEPYIQSQRIEHYARALEKLQGLQRVYPCICSRRDIEEAQSAPHDSRDGLRYPGNCRDLFNTYEEACREIAPGRLPGWRFRTDQTATAFTDRIHGPQQQVPGEAVGDYVLARHPLGGGYMLAVVVDDHAMQISEVLRGDDLLQTTHRQLLIYHALGWTPPQFVHAPLVLAEDGRRLAKRHGDTRIASLRQNGIPPEKVVGLLAHWSGLAAWGEKVSAQKLISRYQPVRIPRTPVFLTQKVKDFLEI